MVNIYLIKCSSSFMANKNYNEIPPNTSVSLHTPKGKEKSVVRMWRERKSHFTVGWNVV